MRAPLSTIIALVALVVALWSTSRGIPAPCPSAAPLARAAGGSEVGPSVEPNAPATRLDGVAPASIDRVSAGSSAPGAAQSAQGAPVAQRDEGRPKASAWAAYDPRAERNARYRAESLPRAWVGLMAEDTNASLRLAYAISIETAAIFTELDERRESFYVPDDGQRHPLAYLAGHHSVACGGANYIFAEGRFPLYDALVRLEDTSSSSPELLAWSSTCPLEAALRARCGDALERLAAYR